MTSPRSTWDTVRHLEVKRNGCTTTRQAGRVIMKMLQAGPFESPPEPNSPVRKGHGSRSNLEARHERNEE
jgi:hypothetical protein